MKQHFKNVLLLYKNSIYASYFLSDRRRSSALQGLIKGEEVERFKKTHENHFWALSYVEGILKKRDVSYSKICRGTSINYSQYDLVITLGGDGTFLEAARSVDCQLIWGINSDPSWSVGRFCSGNPNNFETMLDPVLQKKIKPKILSRISATFSDGTKEMHVLNDLLLCHQNPAALSRYHISIGGHMEEHRSSGLWISTAAGSSGGIYSAGGKILPQESKEMEYRPRELFKAWGASYKLTGGVLHPSAKIELVSLMREGVVFVDGSHVCLPFSFGTTMVVKRSLHPLKVIL